MIIQDFVVEGVRDWSRLKYLPLSMVLIIGVGAAGSFLFLLLGVEQ